MGSLRGVRLNGLDCSRLDLSYAVMDAADLTGFVFAEGLCIGGSWRGVEMSYADVSYANLSLVDGRKAVGTHAVFDHAVLDEANFSQGDFSSASLVSVSARNAYFQQAKLGGADLRSAVLVFAKLQRCDLRGANLMGADLTNARLTGADLRGASIDWEEADVTAYRNALVTEEEYAAIPLDDDVKVRFKFSIVDADYDRDVETSASVVEGTRYNVRGTASSGLRLRAEPRGETLGLIPEGAEVVALGDVVRSRAFTSYHIQYQFPDADTPTPGWVISMFLARIPGQNTNPRAPNPPGPPEEEENDQ